LEVTKTILSLLNSKLCVDRANYVPPDLWRRLLKSFCVCVCVCDEKRNRVIAELDIWRLLNNNASYFVSNFGVEMTRIE
jgi:hypothetical protein